MARIELDLAHAYKPNPKQDSDYALLPLKMAFEDGGAYALLGPSGCGKTVLMRLIAGFEKADAGVISIDDTVVTNSADGTMVTPDKRELGMVFQDYAVWPHMTVFDNIAYPLKLAGVESGELKTRTMRVVDLSGSKAWTSASRRCSPVASSSAWPWLVR